MYEHDENEVLRDALSGLNADVPPMPEGLHAAWMQKVEDDKMEKTLNRKALTRFLSIAAALVFVVGGTLLTRDDLRAPADDLAAGNGNPQIRAMTAAEFQDYMVEYGAYDGSYVMDDMVVEEAAEAEYSYTNSTVMLARSTTTDAAAAPTAPATEEKKIIRTARLTIYTQDYDISLENLRALCSADGGWIESSSESTNSRTGLRTAYLTLRIPQSSLDGYIAGAEQLGRITSRSETAEDVTASYQDTQTRLATQLALMDRLQALITESGDLSDLLALESQIADTQYQIDRLQSSLNNTDRQVSYSTVTVNLYEETVPDLTDTTVTLGERISAAIHTGWNALTDFMQDMLVFLIAALPFISIVAVVVIAIAIIRKIKRRKNA